MESRSPNVVPGRILVRGTNWLGDAVMTTPALLRLREKFPDAHISLLTPEKLREIWLNHPAVNEIIHFSPEESFLDVAKKLRAGKFDVALVLPNSPRSAVETLLARIPKRIGYTAPWRNFFLTQAVPPRPDTVKMRKRTVEEIKELISEKPESKVRNSEFPKSSHQTHEYLHLAAALGANPEPLPPQLFVTPDEIASAAKKFGLDRISNPIIGLNPGAEYGPAKRWPTAKFVTAAREIRRRTNCVWLLVGGKNDVRFTNKIQKVLDGEPAVLNLAGKTTLRELMALLKHCRVFLTNDTGPMHVAAALGVPVVAIFGSTSPELTGPLSSDGLQHQIITASAPCSPCFLRKCPIDFRCMRGIRAERAAEAVIESFNRSPHLTL